MFTPVHHSTSSYHTLITARLPSSFYAHALPRALPSSPTRRSSDLLAAPATACHGTAATILGQVDRRFVPEEWNGTSINLPERSEEHTSELQSRFDLVCRLLLEKKKQCYAKTQKYTDTIVRNQ